MSEKLVVWIDPADTTAARWLVLDANGNRSGFPQRGVLDDVAPLADGRRVIVLLPGEHILAANARVPGNNPRRIVQAAPYALEEKLAGDVDALHVVLLERGAEQHCDFLVIERARLADTLANLRDAGLQPDAIWPDYLGAGPHDGDEHWLLLENGRLLARSAWHGFVAHAADAAFLLGRRDAERALSITVVGDQPPPAALAERETERFADLERAFTEMAARIVELPGAGLLQGEFRRHRESSGNWQRWKWPAIAASAWLAVALADYGVDVYRLQREHAMLEQATADLFEQALPGGRRIQGQERYLLEQALGAGGDDEGRLLDYIADVAAVLQATPNAQLNSYNYRNDYLEFSITVPNATTLEELRARLAEQSGQTVDVQAANSVEGGLEGRLQIGGGTRG